MTPQKEKALAALMIYKTRSEAAEAVGITPRTMRTYFQDDEFVSRYKAAFREMFEDACRQCEQNITTVIDTLKDILQNERESAAARVSAGRVLLENTLKLYEYIDERDKLAMSIEIEDLTPLAEMLKR